jgi:hypothetical protein
MMIDAEIHIIMAYLVTSKGRTRARLTCGFANRESRYRWSERSEQEECAR